MEDRQTWSALLELWHILIIKKIFWCLINTYVIGSSVVNTVLKHVQFEAMQEQRTNM